MDDNVNGQSVGLKNKYDVFMDDLYQKMMNNYNNDTRLIFAILGLLFVPLLPLTLLIAHKRKQANTAGIFVIFYVAAFILMILLPGILALIPRLIVGLLSIVIFYYWIIGIIHLFKIIIPEYRSNTASRHW